MAEIREVLIEIAARLREGNDRRLANVAVSGMVAALVNADALEEAQAVLNAYAVREETNPEPGPQPEPEHPQEEGQGNRELDTYRLKVLEVRDTDRGGVRAWCKTGFNGHTAVYAKGQEAETCAGRWGRSWTWRAKSSTRASTP